MSVPYVVEARNRFEGSKATFFWKNNKSIFSFKNSFFQIFFPNFFLVYYFEITLPSLFRIWEILQIYGNLYRNLSINSYKFLDKDFTLDASPFTETKGPLYVSVLWKKWCTASGWNWTFLSYDVSSTSAHARSKNEYSTQRHKVYQSTLHKEKSNFFPLLHNILLIYLKNKLKLTYSRTLIIRNSVYEFPRYPNFEYKYLPL